MNSKLNIISISGASNSGKTTLINYIRDKVSNIENINIEESISRKVLLANNTFLKKQFRLDTFQLLVQDYAMHQLDCLESSKLTILDRSILDNFIFTKYLYKQKKIQKDTYLISKKAFSDYCNKVDIYYIFSNKNIPIENNSIRENTVGIDKEFNSFFIKEARKLKKKYCLNLEIINTINTKLRFKRIKNSLIV